MSTLGYTGTGSTDTNSTAIFGSKFTTAEAGTVSDITVYVASFTGGVAIRAAIYSDSAGAPSVLLAQSSEGTITGTGWIALPISYVFAPSVTLWLMSWRQDSLVTIGYATPGDVSNQGAYSFDGTYPTWVTPLTGVSALDWKVSIYANYTTVSGNDAKIIFRKA